MADRGVSIAVDECPAGGRHRFRFVSAADQEDDSGRRFYDATYCDECGAVPDERTVR